MKRSRPISNRPGGTCPEDVGRFNKSWKGSMIVKKVLSGLLLAGFLAGLGCGGDSGTAKDKKDTAKKDAAAPKPDTRKDLDAAK
jgi:hypothetical protein